MITLAIAGVLATLAVPGFGALADAWALRGATSAVLAGLAEALLAALARGEEARLCPSAEGRSCTPGRAAGFIVVMGDGAATRVLRVGRLAGRVDISENRPAAKSIGPFSMN